MSEWSTSFVRSGSDAPATSIAAARVNPPVKIPRRMNTSRSCSPSSAPDWSNTASMLRCRSGRSRMFVVSKSNRRFSSSAISFSRSDRVHAAAISIASGIPSTASQIAPTAAISKVATSRPLILAARSRNNSSAAFLPRPPSPSPWRLNRHSCCTLSATRDVTMNRISGHCAAIAPIVAAHESTRCSKLSITTIAVFSRSASTSTASPSPSIRRTATSNARAIRQAAASAPVTIAISTKWAGTSWSLGRVATSAARRVFPAPPGPVMVINRHSGRSSIATRLSISASRPTSGVENAGKPVPGPFVTVVIPLIALCRRGKNTSLRLRQCICVVFPCRACRPQ